jgi:hypothetical protein
MKSGNLLVTLPKWVKDRRKIRASRQRCQPVPRQDRQHFIYSNFLRSGAERWSGSRKNKFSRAERWSGDLEKFWSGAERLKI